MSMPNGYAPMGTPPYRINPSREPLETMSSNNPLDKLTSFTNSLLRTYRVLLDYFHPYPLYRWLINAVLLIIFMIRIVAFQGFYVVAYALGIYLLSSFLLFLTPKFDPALDMDNEADLDISDDEAGPSLPTSSQNEEFKPFVRRLPEFVFWYSSFKALWIALVCTFFSIFDIPVFWPILLIYFIILTAITLKRQIRHMVKYKYVPFDWGKKSYSSSPS